MTADRWGFKHFPLAHRAPISLAHRWEWLKPAIGRPPPPARTWREAARAALREWARTAEAPRDWPSLELVARACCADAGGARPTPNKPRLLPALQPN